MNGKNNRNQNTIRDEIYSHQNKEKLKRTSTTKIEVRNVKSNDDFLQKISNKLSQRKNFIEEENKEKYDNSLKVYKKKNQRYYIRKLLKTKSTKEQRKNNIQNNNIRKFEKYEEYILLQGKKIKILNFMHLKILFLFSIIIQTTSIDSYIILKIGKGYKKVLSNENREPLYTHPSEVYINGDKQDSVTYFYNCNLEVNTVKLLWKYTVTNCLCMFHECDSIIEMDLSHFQTSAVEDMGSMFFQCTSLKSINLANFVTSKVKIFGDMFNGCHSLTTLDLSGFDVSKGENMGHMFTDC